MKHQHKHKGIVCPKCDANSNDKDAAGFRYIEDIQCYRQVTGINDEGRLVVDGFYETGEGYDDGNNPRLECGACCHTFPIPSDVGDDIVWE